MPDKCVSHSYSAAELARLLKKQAAERIPKPHNSAAIHHWDTWERTVEATLEWQAAELLTNAGPQARSCGSGTPSDAEPANPAPVSWGHERQDYPGGPVYRVGTSTGATVPQTGCAGDVRYMRHAGPNESLKHLRHVIVFIRRDNGEVIDERCNECIAAHEYVKRLDATTSPIEKEKPCS